MLHTNGSRILLALLTLLVLSLGAAFAKVTTTVSGTHLVGVWTAVNLKSPAVDRIVLQDGDDVGVFLTVTANTWSGLSGALAGSEVVDDQGKVLPSTLFWMGPNVDPQGLAPTTFSFLVNFEAAGVGHNTVRVGGLSELVEVCFDKGGTPKK